MHEIEKLELMLEQARSSELDAQAAYTNAQEAVRDLMIIIDAAKRGAH